MYTPNTWLQKETWPSRLLYIALRNATEIEKLMDVCPPWAQAREYSFMRPLVLLDVPPSRPRRVLAPGIVVSRTVIHARSRNIQSRDSCPDASRA